MDMERTQLILSNLKRSLPLVQHALDHLALVVKNFNEKHRIVMIPTRPAMVEIAPQSLDLMVDLNSA